jgi:hypothetical protein
MRFFGVVVEVMLPGHHGKSAALRGGVIRPKIFGDGMRIIETSHRMPLTERRNVAMHAGQIAGRVRVRLAIAHGTEEQNHVNVARLRVAQEKVKHLQVRTVRHRRSGNACVGSDMQQPMLPLGVTQQSERNQILPLREQRPSISLVLQRIFQSLGQSLGQIVGLSPG